MEHLSCQLLTALSEQDQLKAFWHHTITHNMKHTNSVPLYTKLERGAPKLKLLLSHLYQ